MYVSLRQGRSHRVVSVLVASEVQRGLRHIRFSTGTTSRDTLLFAIVFSSRDLALVLLIRLVRRHLARENARRNGIHTDVHTRPAKLLCQKVSELNGRRFGGIVVEVVLRGAGNAGDGGDVDDAGTEVGPSRACCAQKWEEGGGHEKVAKTPSELSSFGLGPRMSSPSDVSTEDVLPILGVFGKQGLAELLGTFIASFNVAGICINTLSDISIAVVSRN
jgi:hypothetical protein